MASWRTITFYLGTLAFAMLPNVVLANDTPIRSVGKAIQPRTDVPVRLVSEKVDIIITGDRAFVSCSFNLLNEGPPVTVDVEGIESVRLVGISPDGYWHDDDRLVWKFTDFEPTENIVIRVMENKVYERLVSAQEMLKNNSDNALGHYLLGTVYWIEHRSSVDMDNYRDWKVKSQEELLRAISLDPALNDARWYLATLYDNPKEKKLWREQLETIVENEPSYQCRDELFYMQFIDELSDFRADKWLEWQTARGR